MDLSFRDALGFSAQQLGHVLVLGHEFQIEFIDALQEVHGDGQGRAGVLYEVLHDGVFLHPFAVLGDDSQHFIVNGAHLGDVGNLAFRDAAVADHIHLDQAVGISQRLLPFLLSLQHKHPP